MADFKDSQTDNSLKDDTGDDIGGAEVDANPYAIADGIDGTTSLTWGDSGTIDFGGSYSKDAWGLNGVDFRVNASTFTDSSTAGSGTATNAVSRSIAVPTFAATNASVTMTNAATMYIAGAPTAGTNVTLTNAYALWVDAGATRLDGTLRVDGSLDLNSALQLDATLTVGVDDTGYDVKFFGATSGRYWEWDESADTMNVRGQITVGVDDTGHDVQFFGASAGAYLLWDESADTLDIRGATGAGPGAISLETGETTVVDGDILGRIDFSAPAEASGTDAILVGASIWAEADDTFSASNNDTDLVFAVAESETAAERMRLSYNGTAASLALTGATVMTLSDGSITDSSGAISFGDENLSTTGTLGAGAGTVTSLSVTDGNITNVGDIALDSISSDGSTVTIGTGSTMVFTDDTTIAMTLGNDAGDDFLIDATAFVVEGDTGYVGIGTATPGYNLQVEATRNNDFVAWIENTSSAANQNYGLRLRGGSSSVDTALIIEDYDGANVLLTVKGDGNVGIGGSPLSTLHVIGGDAGTVNPVASDAITFENDGNLYINLLTPSANEAGIMWGEDGDSNVSGIFYSHVNDNFYINTKNTASALYINDSGQVLIGDTANANMTVGLTINQGANDNEAFALKSSDVGHVMTDDVEADTFFEIVKTNATIGGATLRSYSEGNASFDLVGRTQAEVTTDTSTSKAAVNLIGQKQTANTVTDIGSTGNILAVTDGSNTRFIIKGDGAMHATNVTAGSGDLDGTALDNEFDVGLLRTMQRTTHNDVGIIMSKWDKHVKENEDDLKRVGVLSSEGDFLNIQRMFSLQGGGIWQLYEQIMDMCEKLEDNVPALRGKLLPEAV